MRSAYARCVENLSCNDRNVVTQTEAKTGTSSSATTRWLTAACVMPSSEAAAEKPPWFRDPQESHEVRQFIGRGIDHARGVRPKAHDPSTAPGSCGEWVGSGSVGRMPQWEHGRYFSKSFGTSATMARMFWSVSSPLKAWLTWTLWLTHMSTVTSASFEIS